MKKINTLFPFAIFAAGAFFAYYGIEHEITYLTGIGFIFIAAGLVFVGFDNIKKRHLDEYNDAGKLIASYSGISVVFIGIFWCLLGVSAFLLGIFFLIGSQENIFLWMKLHPTLPFLLCGSMLISFNSHELLGSSQERASILPFLGSIPKRIFSIILIIIGITLCFLGLLNLLLPSQYDAFRSFLSTQYQLFQCSISPIQCEE